MYGNWANVYIWNDSEIVVFIMTQTGKSNLIWMIRGLYKFVLIFIRKAWNNM